MVKAKRIDTDLQSLVSKLRVKEKPEANNIIFWGNAQDKPFLPYLKGCVGSSTTFVRLDPITTVAQVEVYAASKRVTKVITTSVPLLKRLLSWDKRAAPSLKDYAGSYFKTNGGLEIVFIHPLKQLATVPYGKFMATRQVEKLTKPNKWFKPSEFSWRLLEPETEEKLYDIFSSPECFLIAIDIETLKENCTIRCIAYTAFMQDGTSHSVVLAIDSMYAVSIMRKWNLLSAPKVLQNGKYDIAYLARYGAPLHAYLYDTAHMFHSMYSELPKDLGFINSFFIREAMYWKDLSKTNDLHEYYKYNALDTWGTGNCFLAMMHEADSTALNNYVQEFSLVPACHYAEMTGIARDMDKLEEAKTKAQSVIDNTVAKLNIMLGIPEGQSFNTNSPKQMKQLLHILGCKSFKSADEKTLKKAMFMHPLNTRILDNVIKVRKARKLTSTYLTKGKEFSTPSGRGNTILYAINPHGTDTSRMASKEHHFWCGLQIQNQPRGSEVKCTYKAYPEFLYAESDYSQAESWHTGFLSGDKKLIDTLENSPNFHSQNASLFFGIPFDEIYDAENSVVLNKPIRQLSKNVNHGANYNMKEYTLIDTMGYENIINAAKLLNLPSKWSFAQIAAYLLNTFHETYPDIREIYYRGIKEEVLRTRKLTSRSIFLTDPPEMQHMRWTRVCFGNPETSVPAFNAYIAHPPQSLNAQVLNRAWLRVFNNIAMHPEHKDNFYLCAQVHDSILYQYREGHEYLCDLVEENMTIPVKTLGYDGVERTYTVPVDTDKGGEYWSQLKG